jgi:hypothetical protein
MQQTRENPDLVTGSDLPSGDGGVGDEQVNAIDQHSEDRPTGQDHSTDHHGSQEPEDGVGAIQDRNLIRNDVADISD